MQRLRRMYNCYHVPQSMIRYRIDIHIRFRNTSPFRGPGGRQRPRMNEFCTNSFQRKGMVEIRPHTPCSDNSYLHFSIQR